MKSIFDNENERENPFPNKDSTSLLKRMKSSINLCYAPIKSSFISNNEFNENAIPSFQSLLLKNRQDIELRNSFDINNLTTNYPDCSFCFTKRNRIQSLE